MDLNRSNSKKVLHSLCCTGKLLQFYCCVVFSHDRHWTKWSRITSVLGIFDLEEKNSSFVLLWENQPFVFCLSFPLPFALSKIKA